MTKKEKISALKIVIDNIDWIHPKECWGLCLLAEYCFYGHNDVGERTMGKLTKTGYQYIEKIIADEVERVGTNDIGYLWKLGNKTPRLRFLIKHLKALEAK